MIKGFIYIYANNEILERYKKEKRKAIVWNGNDFKSS